MPPARIHYPFRLLSPTALAPSTLLLSLVLTLFPGCADPLAGNAPRSASLQLTLDRLLAQELLDPSAPSATTPFSPTPPPSQPQSADQELDLLLASRRDQLETLGPSLHWRSQPISAGPDLLDQPELRVRVSRDQALLHALQHNLDLRQAHLAARLSREDITRARAAFDFLLFGNIDFEKTDEPAVVPTLQGIPLSPPVSAQDRVRFQTGLRKRLPIGGELQLSTDLARLQNNTPGFRLFPDPAYTAGLRAGISQPFLRGFGSDITLADIRFASTAAQRANLDLQVRLLDLARDTDAAYWDLLAAWEELAVSHWLVLQALQSRDILAKRREFDADPAEYADAVAQVQQRNTAVIRARLAIRQASDHLKLLMNAPGLSPADDSVIEPADDPPPAPVDISLADAFTHAVHHRPELAQAGLLIDDEELREKIAENRLLPVLDLRGEAAVLGLDDSPAAGFSELSESRFIDFIAGLVFEMPLGNRDARAALRAQRLRSLSALTAYRSRLQSILSDVKSALRSLRTQRELMLATTRFRIAQAENLRALLVEEEHIAGMTPEFLNLKFSRQESLAAARRQEVAARVEHAKALAHLLRAIGRLPDLDSHSLNGDAGVVDESVNRQSSQAPPSPPTALELHIRPLHRSS